MKKNKQSQSQSFSFGISSNNSGLPLFENNNKNIEILKEEQMNITITHGKVKKVYDTKTTEKGVEYTNFLLEVTKTYEDRNKEKKHLTSNFNFCKFGTCDINEGDEIIVTGELSSRKDGDKYNTSVVVKQIDKISQHQQQDSNDKYFINNLPPLTDCPF